MDPKWHFLPQAAMMVPADKMANPLQHTSLTDAELLMREAIQNSADERRTDADGPVRFSVRRKQYRGDEKSVLVGKFGLEEIAERAKSFPEAHGWFKFEKTCLGRLDDPDVPISALLGVVTLTAIWPACGRRRRRLCNGRHLPPLSHRVAAELAECSAGDQMALDVEEVVDGRMDGEEPLRGRGRFEPLHLSLSSSHRLM